jgi:hypothetical protein
MALPFDEAYEAGTQFHFAMVSYISMCMIPGW